MASLIRLCVRRQAAASASGSSSLAQRPMHTSQPLDPTRHIPQASPANVAQTAADGAGAAAASTPESRGSLLSAMEQPLGAAASDGTHVHARLAYLHPSTKEAPSVTRAGDLKTGRVRPEPQYVPLSAYVFGTEPRRDIIHASVIYTLDARRQGTASTKTRGEVNFSGRKLRPQKGSGSARLGTRGSPVLRKGGVAHGPKPRDMSSKLNRRVREQATRAALSLRWQTGDLHVVKSLLWDRPPGTTAPLNRLLSSKHWDDALFLTAPRSPAPASRHALSNPKPSAADPVYTPEQVAAHRAEIYPFTVASNNIPRVTLIQLHQLTSNAHEAARKKEDLKKPGELHAYEVLMRKKVVLDLGAVEWLEEKLGGAIFHALGDAELMADAQDEQQQQQQVGAADAVADVADVAEEDAAEEVLDEEAEAEAERKYGEAMRNFDEASQSVQGRR